MASNNKKAAALAAMKATAATLTTKAFAASEGEGALVNAMRVACGPKPTVEQFSTFRRAIVVGAMASHLAQQGDNRTDKVLFALCEDLLDNYQGMTGTAPVRNGMKGRRTKPQEDAYTYARKVVQRICARAGVENPEPRGKTGAATTAKNNADAKAKKDKAAKSAAKESNGKLAIKTFKKPEPFVEYALIAAKSLQSTYNKSAPTIGAASVSKLGDAIAALMTAATETAGELGMNV